MTVRSPSVGERDGRLAHLDHQATERHEGVDVLDGESLVLPRPAAHCPRDKTAVLRPALGGQLSRRCLGDHGAGLDRGDETGRAEDRPHDGDDVDRFVGELAGIERRLPLIEDA